MKTTKTCPKCGGRRVWRVERFEVPSEGAAGAPVRVTIERPPSKGLFARASNSHGHIDAWICDGCGFTEFWARDLDGLQPAPQHGVVFFEDGTAAVKR